MLPSIHVRQASGLEYLALVTQLLQRARQLDPTGGIWEAADFQWWWRRDQHPDPVRQTFWLDHDLPVAALSFNNWGRHLQCDPILATPDPSSIADAVWARALADLAAMGREPVEIIARDDDQPLLDRLVAAGFVPTGEVSVTTWLAAKDRPKVPPLRSGFTLVSRSETAPGPHHLIRRNGEHVAERLLECSLYRPDLDLVVHAPNGEVAAYSLFWADPVTRVGLVEPMRVEDRYQRLGLGRHLLAGGLDRLASAGCSRLKVTYVEGNEAARRLYLGAGFRPDAVSRTYRRGA